MPFRSFPKVELHLHLDCSLSYAVASRLRPGLSRGEYERDFVAPPRCRSLADFLTRAPTGFRLLQDREALRLATEDLFRQLEEDGVVYAEIRFAPLLHTEKGLTAEDVVETVDRTADEAGHPIDAHVPAFRWALERGYARTAHAGEATRERPEDPADRPAEA